MAEFRKFPKRRVSFASRKFTVSSNPKLSSLWRRRHHGTSRSYSCLPLGDRGLLPHPRKGGNCLSSPDLLADAPRKPPEKVKLPRSYMSERYYHCHRRQIVCRHPGKSSGLLKKSSAIRFQAAPHSGDGSSRLLYPRSPSMEGRSKRGGSLRQILSSGRNQLPVRQENSSFSNRLHPLGLVCADDDRFPRNRETGKGTAQVFTAFGINARFRLIK